MKAAVPFENGRIFQHFGKSSAFLVAEIEDIVHIGAGLLRRPRLGITAGNVRRGVCLEVVLHALRHGVYRL